MTHNIGHIQTYSAVNWIFWLRIIIVRKQLELLMVKGQEKIKSTDDSAVEME